MIIAVAHHYLARPALKLSLSQLGLIMFVSFPKPSMKDSEVMN